MVIEQLYTKCLSQCAYYIESDGEAAVIDPLRDVAEYIDLAKAHNARITYVFETHFHADFVSGHLDLAAKTKATIVYGPNAEPGFSALVARDGQEFHIGQLTIVLLHTPGHTLESSCYLLKDKQGKPLALFTGDTLFIGDVGRPDVAQTATGLSKETLAGMLYDSIQSKIMPLPGAITIYPGHGAGSACGKNMCSETTDTLAHQQLNNYALRPGISKQEFVNEVIKGLTIPPAYFSADASRNKGGYEQIDTVIQRGLKPLQPQQCKAAMEQQHALILDTRNPEEFCRASIPGSVNIGLDGQFAPWAGTLFPDMKQPIIIVAEKGREEESIRRLARVGHDNVIGYLENGFGSWYHGNNEINWIINLSAQKLAEDMASAHRVIIDVRENAEYEKDHVTHAIHIPLSDFQEKIKDLNPLKPYYVYCKSGYRSVIFISLLRAYGFRYLINVSGGFNAISSGGKIGTEATVFA
jgi:hydroxyacylglutathione hydrolase